MTLPWNNYRIIRNVGNDAALWAADETGPRGGVTTYYAVGPRAGLTGWELWSETQRAAGGRAYPAGVIDRPLGAA